MYFSTKLKKNHLFQEKTDLKSEKLFDLRLYINKGVRCFLIVEANLRRRADWRVSK